MEEAYQFYIEWGLASIIGFVASVVVKRIETYRKKRKENRI